MKARSLRRLTYNTVDNPVNPTHGKSLFLSSSFEGGPLGGNVNTVSEVVEAKYFRPNYHNRNVIAMRFLGGVRDRIRRQSDPSLQPVLSGRRGRLARIRYPHGFAGCVRSDAHHDVGFVSESDGAGRATGSPTPGVVNIPTLSYQTSFPGGDTEAVVNFEYRIPLFPHVSLSIFGDAGATGALRQDQLQLNSTGLHVRSSQQFPNHERSAARCQFQPGTNFKLRTSAGVELVVQLPIVQAPFRIYWAYNFNRMSQVITAPADAIPGTGHRRVDDSVHPTSKRPNQCPWNIYKAQAPFTDVWNSQVAPQILNLFNNPQRTNFFDPVRTFRFTVSRTF